MGTVNGLIFYANVVWASSVTFLSSTNPYTVFIAWLNFDLGIESCFANHLNAYLKTWIQLLYSQVAIALLLVLCRYSSFAARVLGNNSIPVLTTLLLLSYAKLARIIIIVLSFSVINDSQGGVSVRWTYDGTVEYFGLKHAFLGGFAIFTFLFLFLPYTSLLLFARWIQRMPCQSYWVRRWILRLKPYFDAYGAPFVITIATGWVTYWLLGSFF